MSDHEGTPLRDIDRYVLEARAAHVYLDALAWLKDAAQQQRNVASARQVLAGLERALLEAPADDPIRTEVQALRDRLSVRLGRVAG